LRELIAGFERGGIVAALGGSALLAALGLADQVRDWDLTVDAEPAAVRPRLEDPGWAFQGGDLLHADHKFSHEAWRIEVICRFAFHVPCGVVRLPLAVSRRWRDLPIASPEAWAVAYALLAEGEASERRRERAERLFAWLAREGADGRIVRALLGEPLPDALRARLAALHPAR
jgi:hypothetical protein